MLINITTGNNEKGLKMNDLNLINQRISEHTGNANNFKRGLIWDDDPEIGDTIHITAIATGFKFNSLIGPDINLGNIIRIPKDFVYDKNEMARTDGIILYENTSSHIGYSTKENLRIFDFDLDQKPALVVSVGESLSELENVPAIRRNQQ